MINLKGISNKNKHKLIYPDIASARRPVPHDDLLPVPKTPETLDQPLTNDENTMEEYGVIFNKGQINEDPDFLPPLQTKQPQLFTQDSLNDLIRELYMSKENSQIFASRLRERGLLCSDVKISLYRYRNDSFKQHFTVEGSLVYCHDVAGLFNEFGENINFSEWRLFIDSNKTSLKFVLLHNGNVKPSIPLAHSVHLKETYDSIQIVLELIRYDLYQWQICGDLKVIGTLMGLQGGFTKHCCFLCLWNSRMTNEHYTTSVWEPRPDYNTGKYNIVNEPLVDPSMILLPPLHIKLGLIKNLVKAMAKNNSKGFQFLQTKFPKITEAKIKEGVFNGPQIRELFVDKDFVETLQIKEKRAWNSFNWICHNFLGRTRSPNYKEGVEELLAAYKDYGCRMSLKIHFLHSHLEFFPKNLGDVSDEQGERFHQDIKQMEQRYQGFWNESMMGDYCWMLVRSEPNIKHRRMSFKNHF